MNDHTDPFKPQHFLQDLKNQKIFFIDKDMILGRKTEFPVPGEDVSSQHCQLSFNGGKLQIQDLESTNGTFVNERKLQKGEVLTLLKGDRIRIGRGRVFLYTTKLPSEEQMIFEILKNIKEHWWVYVPLLIIVLAIGIKLTPPQVNLPPDILFLKPYLETTPPWFKIYFFKFMAAVALIFMHAYGMRIFLTEEKFPKAWVSLNFATYVVVLVMGFMFAKKVEIAYVKNDLRAANFHNARVGFLKEDLHQSYNRHFIKDYGRTYLAVRQQVEDNRKALQGLGIVFNRDILAMKKKYDNPYYRDVFAEIIQIQ